MLENLVNLAESKPTAQPQSKSLVSMAYAQVRRDVIEGRLLPGSRLRVDHLKDVYGVSSGTLREALALLVSDGLVVSHNQRGFHVTSISITDFADITNTRIMLETEALRQSIRDGDDMWESQVIAAFHRLSRAQERLADNRNEGFDEWEERNREFHRALLSACSSRWTHHFLGVLYRQAERYRRLVVTHQPIPRDVHHEHKNLVDAALARNANLATGILTQHISTTFDAVKELPGDLFNEAGAEVAG